MSGIVGDLEQAAGSKMNKDAQPGDNIERTADQDVNQEVNKVAGDAGVPQGADNTIDQAVDGKVNSDIPGGNN
ncbi:putative Antitoxin [Seiridium cardinale]|uniref:Antitoxin n=1 Tax=Seiridium cardinale TaxID=138064 RepID=A0ABR2XXV2_9PEZI